MKIDVLGCGSAFSCTQNTSALRVIDADNKQWLIDCGLTVPPRALAARRRGQRYRRDLLHPRSPGPLHHSDGATEPLEKLFPSEASHYLLPAGAAAGAHAAGRAGELAAGGPWFHHRLAGMPRSLDVAGLADPHCPPPSMS